ncbi:MAG TPA: alpha/beta fold hydrolase [Usitatibacteraceae bacterium]|nr:alpha/beta fold hydrolase [Usitatibacteraceae bacterium]
MPAVLFSSMNSTIGRSMKMLSTRARLQVGAIVAPERAVADAVRLFLTPPRRLIRDRDRVFLAGGEGFVVAVGEARLSAWRFGPRDRPAVILSHGWGGRGAQFHAFVPALIDAGFQAVVFDHAGHGLSEGRQSSLIDFGRGLGAVANALTLRGIRIAGVVGHSLGAAAIAPFLRASNRSVRSVLVAPPASLVGYSAWFARKLGLGEKLRSRLQSVVEGRYGVRWDELELPASVASLASPALVIHDENDSDVRISAGLAIARAWPGARFVRTRGLGHTAILRDAGVVRDAIDFLKGEVVFARPPAAGEWSAFPGPAPLI